MNTALNMTESGLQPGVFWPGKLPSDWRVKRLKFAVRLVSAKAAYGESDLPYMGLEHIESWTGRYLEDEDASPDGVVSHFVSGDVLLGKLRPYLAKVHLARHRGVCSTEALVLRASEELLPEYLRYFLVAPVTIEHINSSTYGSKMPRASWDFIGNQLQPLPPLGQQQKIAAFLDRKTAEIDTLIAKKHRLLDRLAEKRTALITRAVTKGLNPDVLMKGSGIEWLGEIPAHWVRCKLRNVLARRIRNGLYKPESEKDESGVPFVQMGEAFGSNVYSGGAKTRVSASDSELKKWGLRSGDLLFARRSIVFDGSGRCTRIGEINEPHLFESSMILARPNTEICFPPFLHMLFESKAMRAQVLSITKTVTISGLDGEQLKSLNIILPPIDEQKAIVQKIEKDEKEGQRIEGKIVSVIERLREYRSALITNAVTGQIKVT